jgi:hypothetical protein
MGFLGGGGGDSVRGKGDEKQHGYRAFKHQSFPPSPRLQTAIKQLRVRWSTQVRLCQVLVLANEKENVIPTVLVEVAPQAITDTLGYFEKVTSLLSNLIPARAMDRTDHLPHDARIFAIAAEEPRSEN